MKIEEEKDYLTELDNVIGDGDHGINMARGFKAVEEKLPSLAGKDIGIILKGIGLQLVSNVGGASGPLYGTAFMKAGAACTGLVSMDAVAFVQAMEAAVQGIEMRGKAHEGEKTMLDALCPALKALRHGESTAVRLPRLRWLMRWQRQSRAWHIRKRLLRRKAVPVI